MDETSQMMQEVRSASSRWDAFRVTAPLLLKALEPMREHAPDLLEMQPVVEALLAIYLVSPQRFKTVEHPLPGRVSDKLIVQTWTKPFNFWKHDKAKALSYTCSDGKKDFVWPYMEAALRHLIPGLPVYFLLPRDLEKAPEMLDPKIRSFLMSVTLVFNVVMRRP